MAGPGPGGCPTNAALFSLPPVSNPIVVTVRMAPNNRVAMIDATLVVSSNLGGATPNRSVPLKVNSITAGLAVTPSTNVLDFGPHGRVANSLRILGIETVETALGRFAAWKAPITSTSEQFGKVDGCDWWRPALGAPLRFEMIATGPDGSRLQTAAVLRATSRALD